jgi:signal transduction histidine kinase
VVGEVHVAAQLRQTGIGVVGDVPWGTHFFLFQETKEDLLDALVPYFKAGLENREFCIWVIADPLTEEEAWNALRQRIPDIEKYVQDESMQIVKGREWYMSGGDLDLGKVARVWNDKLEGALARGYCGLRLSGDTAWLDSKHWKKFAEYENEINHFMTGKPTLALCTYPLRRSSAEEILDVTRTHQFAIARRNGGWEVVETSELKQAKAEIKRLNDELGQRVVERTRQLTIAIEGMRQLSIRLMDLQETERAHLARELHDEIGQLLTGLRLLLKRNGDLPGDAFNLQIEQARTIVDDLLARVQGLSFDLRPAALDQLGLLPALLASFERYTVQTGVLVNFKHQGVEGSFASEVETCAYRVVQEALTNVARHAGVAGVTVRVWANTDMLNLHIADRGRGFDPEVALKAPNSSGLIGMQERVTLLRGRMTIESSPGSGTTITAELPVDKTGVT